LVVSHGSVHLLLQWCLRRVPHWRLLLLLLLLRVHRIACGRNALYIHDVVVKAASRECEGRKRALP
jgi:hypothetical protein